MEREREGFRLSDVDFYSQMAFSDCKTVLSLNLELKEVIGNFIWSLVIAWILDSALTLSLNLSWNQGRETLHSALIKWRHFRTYMANFFDFNQWNNDFRLYESASLGRNLSLHLVNHHHLNIIGFTTESCNLFSLNLNACLSYTLHQSTLGTD